MRRRSHVPGRTEEGHGRGKGICPALQADRQRRGKENSRGRAHPLSLTSGRRRRAEQLLFTTQGSWSLHRPRRKLPGGAGGTPVRVPVRSARARPGAVSAAQRRAACCVLLRRPAALSLPCDSSPVRSSRQAGALLRARGRASAAPLQPPSLPALSKRPSVASPGRRVPEASRRCPAARETGRAAAPPRACAAAALTRGALSSCVLAGGGAGRRLGRAAAAERARAETAGEGRAAGARQVFGCCWRARSSASGASACARALRRAAARCRHAGGSAALRSAQGAGCAARQRRAGRREKRQAVAGGASRGACGLEVV
jgi:hypothetical protein